MAGSSDDLEILGMIGTSHASETHSRTGPALDKSYTAAFALAHEQAGFDRVLIGYGTGFADGFQVAGYVAHHTTRLKFLLAHRPGFVQPTLAARQMATLDQFCDGRLAVHIISGGSDAEQQREGDFLAKDERYARTDDYIDVLKKTWTSSTPFDHDGPYYRLRNHIPIFRPAQQPHPPIFFGGSSEAAVRVAGRHADTYAFFGEPLEQAREMIGLVSASAAAHGRADRVRFSMSFRPILGRTEDEAWARAERILEAAKALKARSGPGLRFSDESMGSKRLLEAASGGKVRDKRLWTEIAELTGAQGNSTALVGTGEQVAETLLDYYDLGVRTFLFRGFEPLEDAIDYGRNLLPVLRQAVAARRPAGAVAAE